MFNIIKKFQDLAIGIKLISLFLFVGIIPLVLVAIISLNQSSTALHEQSFNQLKSVRDIKKRQVVDYFNSIENQVVTLSMDEMTIDAMRKFDDEFSKLGDNSSEAKSIAQALYIHENPNALGEKHLLDAAPDNSGYSQAHLDFHPLYRDYLERFGYYDIFLVEPHDGYIVYSVFKELDYATSLISGEYADANIADVFKKSARSSVPKSIEFTDFLPYAPSHGAPASFISSPIVDNGETIGVLVFQMPLGNINAIMQERSGMGESGESYLIGSDLLMRSDSFLDPINHSVLASFTDPSLGSVETVAGNAAVNGEIGEQIIIDYNGNPVLSAYSPIDIYGTATWGLLAEIDEAEAFAVTDEIRNMSIILALVLSALVAGLAVLISRSITQPIHILMKGMTQLGEGDLTSVVSISVKDEIGQMAEAFNSASTKLSGAMVEILGSSKTVATAATNISASSEELAAGAEEQQAQLSEVATTMEEMSAMILEASQNADGTRVQAQQTGDTATTGRDTVSRTVEGFEIVAKTVDHAAGQIQELNRRSEEIGNVIQVIDDIADQTNLLALNANIEAARAGDAGRGFAVVADEVRKLAERTVSATAEISKMIESIQTEITGAVESMSKIQDQSKSGLDLVSESDKSLEEISGSITSVVTAVEQIATASAEQSSGAEEISKNIEGVTTVAKESAMSAQQLASSADNLNQEVESLDKLIGQFKVE